MEMNEADIYLSLTVPLPYPGTVGRWDCIQFYALGVVGGDDRDDSAQE